MQLRTALLGTLLWAFGACGGGAPPPAEPAPRVQPVPSAPAPPPPITEPTPPAVVASPPPAAEDPRTRLPTTVDEAIATMGVFRDDMCKCTTKDCADEVTEALTRWGQLLAGNQHWTRDIVTDDHTQRMAAVTEAMTKCMTTAMLAGLPPNGAAPASTAALTSTERAPFNIAPSALEANRIAGNKYVLPDSDDRKAIAGSGKAKVVSSYKLCIDLDGNPARISTLKSSGYRGYDAKILREMHDWRFRPFVVNGANAPVCTAVTVIYSKN